MSDNKGAPPPDGEHIEELLSQLKGIFGHLSETEKEESKQKIAPPAASLPRVPAPAPIPEPEPAAPPSELPPAAPDPIPSGIPLEPPIDVSDLPPLEPWIPSDEPEPAPAPAPTPVSAAAAAPPVAGSDGFTPTIVSIPEGASLIPTAIFYPAGRINEAKIVAEKVERITPKFTKVAVVVNVQTLAAYDAKMDLKTTVLAQLTNSPIKAVFVLIDKSLDEVKRKALVAELEPRGIYLQEIPSHQVEKKALYTDMLLGMVFFFDSQKQAPGESSS